MKVFTIAAKTLKELARQPKNLGIILGLPIAFMLIFGFAFGASSSSSYELMVVDEDGGDVATPYLDGIRALEYDDGTPIFEVTLAASEAEGREAVTDARVDALLLIPANFSEDAVPQAPADGGPVPPLTQPQTGPPAPKGAIAQVVGDPSRPDFQAASQVLAAYSAAFAEGMSQSPPWVKTETEAITASELTAFDFIAPGLMVFAILNMVPQAAAVLARETENRTLDRIRMSPTGSLAVLTGVALAQLVMACVSLGLMLVTAEIMGFHNQGSYLTAYLVALVAALAVTGIGMMIASFARNQQEAANFGVLVSVPASFLSGAFFAIPGISIAGFNLYDVLPTTHAVYALRQVLTLGRDVEVVMGALYALAGLALVYFACGVLLYRRMRLTPE